MAFISIKVTYSVLMKRLVDLGTSYTSFHRKPFEGFLLTKTIASNAKMCQIKRNLMHKRILKLKKK